MNSFRRLTLTAMTCLLLNGITRLHGQIIVSMDPPIGATGEQIILTGTGFAPGTLKVTFFNGVQDKTAVATATTTIYAHVPAGARTGPITVQVGANSATSVQDFTVVGLGPYISDIQPAFGAVNDKVFITGLHLNNVTSVKFGGGKNSTSVLPNANGTQITALVPAGATNGFITVTTSAGTSNSPTAFTVIGAGPYVAGFIPAVGTPGDKVSILGAHLLTVTNVSFSGKSAAIDPSQAPTDGQLSYIVPSGVVSGPITVRSPKGTFTTATNFFVPPLVTGFSPTTGRQGTNINIRGNNLLGTTAVKLAGVSFPVSSATNNTNLVFSVPAGVSSGSIAVMTPAGQTLPTTSNFTFQPLITGFTPAGGAPATTVIISGANFNEVAATNAPKIKFNGTNALVTGVSFGLLSAVVPAGVETGPLTITTTNGSFTTVSNFFMPPVITSLTPSNGLAGSTVALRGTNLLGVTNVLFNGKAAAFRVPTNNYFLSVTVPTNVITGPIRISTPGGFADSGGNFYGQPAITGFAPLTGVPGTLVTISGTNLSGVTAVKFNGVPVTDLPETNNNSLLQVIVPNNATTGKISVTTPAGTVTSSSNFTIDLESRLSVSMQASQSQVFSGSNATYQIIVVNAGPFNAPNTKVVNLLPASATLQSYTNSQGTVQVSGRQVTALLGTLNNQKVATLQITAKLQGTGPLVDTVSVTSDYPDPDLSDNTNSVSVFGLPLPILKIGPYSASQLMVSWPVLLTNYVVQYDNFLGAGATWSNLVSPPLIVGTNKFVIEPATLPMRYYRLKQ